MLRSRRHPGYFAFLGHRLSGLVLALFLPLHFLMLGKALDPQAFDLALRVADNWLFKFAEWGLVVALSLHLVFGLRVLMLEFLPWRDTRSKWIGAGILFAAMSGLVFLWRIGG